MFSANSEDKDFSAIPQKELEEVNGGYDPITIAVTMAGSAALSFGVAAAVTEVVAKRNKK